MTHSQNGYSSGHPWYYLLGGNILKPKQILKAAIEKDYNGYRADEILRADQQVEPERSEKLRQMKAEILDRLWVDISSYRQYAFQLRKLRRQNNQLTDQLVCKDIHTNISLKHNHIYNDMAHLHLVNNALSKQKDLFD